MVVGVDIPQRVIDRIQQRVELEPASECWLWTGALAGGYGRIAWSEGGNKMVYRAVHRVLYTALVGPIPDGLDLDHLCHDPVVCSPVRAEDCPHRRCCNPSHLEPVTRQTNLLRGGTVPAARAERTHCPQGHRYDESNTIFDKQGRRICRTCSYARNRAYHDAHRADRNEANRAWRRRRKSGS